MPQAVPKDFTIDCLRAAYRAGLSVQSVAAEVLCRVAAAGDDKVWINRIPAAELAATAAALDARRAELENLPLFGVPFAVKDNIDVAGLPTTAACPDFAYQPERSATVVQRLLAAGALLIGKTNLDQFATGLVGVRSPYGVPRNAFNADFVPGGSSSGSAVAVASGLVAFSLGTDTAGSGRIPAGFNNIVGLKPTRGALSTAGVVPACRSLDCVSIFGLTVADVMAVEAVAAAEDDADGFSRAAPPAFVSGIQPGPVRVGIPPLGQLNFFGDADYERLWLASVSRLKALGHNSIEVDFEPFLETARLLYSGPWLAERTAALGTFLDDHAASIWPVTREIIGGGKRFSAIETFRAQYRLEELRRVAGKAWHQIDALLLPTAGTIYRVAEIEADPVALNSNLGAYTNFMNLLDLCGIAVPAGFRADGMPFGVTLAGPAWSEGCLAGLAQRLHHAAGVNLGACNSSLPAAVDAIPAAHPALTLAVCGAHMTGLPLARELLSLGAVSLGITRTAPVYRFYRLPGAGVARPGLVRVTNAGTAIEVELWRIPAAAFGAFIARVPAPLAIGTIELADGSAVKGFICEAAAVEGAADISGHGGWRAYLASLAGSTSVSATA